MCYCTDVLSTDFGCLSVNFYGDFIDASLPDKLRPVIVGKKASELTDLSVQNLFVKF